MGFESDCVEESSGGYLNFFIDNFHDHGYHREESFDDELSFSKAIEMEEEGYYYYGYWTIYQSYNYDTDKETHSAVLHFSHPDFDQVDYSAPDPGKLWDFILVVIGILDGLEVEYSMQDTPDPAQDDAEDDDPPSAAPTPQDAEVEPPEPCGWSMYSLD